MTIVDRPTAEATDFLEIRRNKKKTQTFCEYVESSKSTEPLRDKYNYVDLEDPLSVDDLIYSGIGCTSVSIDDHWSTAYTIDGNLDDVLLVSKSMNTNQDPQTDTRPMHLYFNRYLPEVYLTPAIKDNHAEFSSNVNYCLSWSELSDKMKLRPKSICFHVSELEHSSAIEIVNMVNTLAKLLEITEVITVTVGIEKDTPYQLLKELQKTNIFGIVPSTPSFGIDETSKALNAQWNNIPYWPRHILEQLPGAKKLETKKPGEIKLTHRQQQILDLIKERGASNKIIAKTLNITESTVKLHVGLVLKKFGVKNRTQLALFSKK